MTRAQQKAALAESVTRRVHYILKVVNTQQGETLCCLGPRGEGPSSLLPCQPTFLLCLIKTPFRFPTPSKCPSSQWDRLQGMGDNARAVHIIWRFTLVAKKHLGITVYQVNSSLVWIALEARTGRAAHPSPRSSLDDSHTGEERTSAHLLQLVTHRVAEEDLGRTTLPKGVGIAALVLQMALQVGHDQLRALLERDCVRLPRC